MAESDLTFRQRMFVEAYLGEANGNASEAARIAGYAEPHSQGPRLLENVGVRSRIEARASEAAMAANEVLARLSDQASGDMADFVDVVGENEYRLNLKKAEERGRLHLVKKITPTKFGIGIELYDAHAALVQLGRYHSLFTDKTDVTSKGEVLHTPIQIVEVVKPAPRSPESD